MLFVQFLIVFAVPVVLVIVAIRFIASKLRKEKMIKVYISNYNYKVFVNHAKRLNEPVRKRISTVLNTYHNVTHRY
jgi:hypothetical protein